jgi:hypothetical protein
VDFLIFLAGTLLTFWALLSAIRTFVLPRSAPDLLARVVFRSVRGLFNLLVGRMRTFKQRDRVMAFYAPISLLLLLPTWLTVVLIGYMGMFWSLGLRPWTEAFNVSGSSLLTLGFARGEGFWITALEFSEATIGLILVALLIAYLPTMYNAFSSREQAVTLLEVRAGSPPSALEMLSRFHRIGKLADLAAFWEGWEAWFAALAESHTSLAALVFFRSPRVEASWVTASGAVLDGAALKRSVVDLPRDPQEALCIRAGFVALRQIADNFGISYESAPQWPENPISIERADFLQACDTLARQGVPLVPDLEQAWQDFAGWRVNYDAVLLALARITMAPKAPWATDLLEDISPT